MMLDTGSIGVPDWPPPFQYALADLAHTARAVADNCHEHDDRVIWALLFDDVRRLEIRDRAYRSIWREKFQTVPRPDPQASLFAEEAVA